MANEVIVTVRAKDEASKTFQGVEKSASGLGKTLGDVGKIAGGFLAASVISNGVQALTGFIGDSVAAARESIQVNAQLEAVLKSTGGVAGMTAKEVQDMAGELEKLSLFEDEAIISSSALLLTFTKIGEDVFPQAQQAILDLAQAMGMDLQSATVMVGKALNDPIAGLTAMSRAGIQFTEDQKAMIKEMVTAGDVAGAQAVILGELAVQFGGSAQAASDAAGKNELYKDRMNELKEQIGTQLIPVQEKWLELQAAAVTFISTQVLPAVQSFTDYVMASTAAGQSQNDMLLALPEALQGFAQATANASITIQENWAAIEASVRIFVQAAEFELNYFMGIVNAAITVINTAVYAANKLVNAFNSVKNAASSIAGGIIPDFGGFFGRAAGGPVMGGSPYIVGEKGPELFVPGSSGTIVPNHALGGAGGVTVNINGPVYASDAAGARRTGNDIGWAIALRRQGLAV